MFINRFEAAVNKRVRDFLGERRKEGMVICLATAAPAFYANKMRKYFDFDFILGTLSPKNHDVWVENIREEKLRTVSRLARREGLAIDTVISNHFDDLPLFGVCRKAILVNASRETIALLSKKGIIFQQLK